MPPPVPPPPACRPAVGGTTSASHCLSLSIKLHRPAWLPTCTAPVNPCFLRPVALLPVVGIQLKPELQLSRCSSRLVCTKPGPG